MAPQVRDGYATFSAKAGDTYKVIVHNHSAMDALASVTVDGLNSFIFSDDNKGRMQENPTATYERPYYLKARQSGEVPGWFKENHRCHEFRLARYSPSSGADADVRDPAAVGTITVLFERVVIGQTPRTVQNARRQAAKGPVGLCAMLMTVKGSETACNDQILPGLDVKSRQVMGSVSIRYSSE